MLVLAQDSGSYPKRVFRIMIQTITAAASPKNSPMWSREGAGRIRGSWALRAKFLDSGNPWLPGSRHVPYIKNHRMYEAI